MRGRLSSVCLCLFFTVVTLETTQAASLQQQRRLHRSPATANSSAQLAVTQCSGAGSGSAGGARLPPRAAKAPSTGRRTGRAGTSESSQATDISAALSREISSLSTLPAGSASSSASESLDSAKRRIRPRRIAKAPGAAMGFIATAHTQVARRASNVDRRTACRRESE